MFEAAEIGRTLAKEEFKELEPKIHHQVLQLQQRLRKSDKSLIIIISGVEGAGKGEVVERLNRWLDFRDVQTHAYWDETDEESQRPKYWRFWRDIPMRGTVAVMFGSWYTNPLIEAAFDRLNEAELDQALTRNRELERTLTDGGAIILKLWFHLPKDEQKNRLESEAKVSKFKKSPLLEEFSKKYDKFVKVSEHALQFTDTGDTPWHIIEATDPRYRDAAVGRALVECLERGLGSDVDQVVQPTTESDPVGSVQLNDAELTVLDAVDLSLALTEKEYSKRLLSLQAELHDLSWQMHKAKRNAVLLFEGWDAGGKGSAIRRLTQAIDARLYRVIPVAAPTDEEKGHHYLWRFWRHVPRAGYITIYDRSWYGRVLVERVEGFARREEWLRSYQEINEFEDQLVDHGVVLCKFWLHISKDEQLRRFKERENEPRKQHKITEEDWRNREKWDDYKLAVNDMVAHTSLDQTSWTLVSGNDKLNARIQILETVCGALRKALGLPPSQESDSG